MTDQADLTITKSDVAKLLKISPRSVSNLMTRGLPFIKIGAKIVRFRLGDIRGYLNARKVN